jgi:hypothetical protein
VHLVPLRVGNKRAEAHPVRKVGLCSETEAVFTEGEGQIVIILISLPSPYFLAEEGHDIIGGRHAHPKRHCEGAA